MSGTTLASHDLDDPAQIALFADNWTSLGVGAADRFKEACRQVAAEHDGDVNPSLVRAKLLVAGELDIPCRQYSALWGTACSRDGYLQKTGVRVQIVGAGSKGNGNKSVEMRRWIGPVPTVPFEVRG